MGGPALDPWEVVGSFGSAVGGSFGVVPVEDLVTPGDDRVDDAMVLGRFAGGVGIGEPVVGEVEAVELLQRVPSGLESRVGRGAGRCGPVRRR